MERTITLANTEKNVAITLPVTPKSYPMGAGRAVERLDMAQTGQVALPGLKTLFTESLEFMLPAQNYPFMSPGAVADPQYYIGQLTAWSRDANVCRYIVAGTDINIPVLLGPLEYGENDGTNDVNCKLPLYEYRYLDEAKVEQVTQNNGRVQGDEPAAATKYTVVKGDCLWVICRRYYGDGSLAYKLATANGIKNPNLVYPGQVLTLPDKAALLGYAPTAAPSTSRGGGSADAKLSGSTDAKPSGSTKTPYEEAQEEKFAARRSARVAIGLGTDAQRREQQRAN